MAAIDEAYESWWSVNKGMTAEDKEALEKFRDTGLTKFEEMCIKAGDKWLLGTDEPTLLDIYAGSSWEIMYLRSGGVYEYSDSILQKETVAPHWLNYVKRFRAYPAFHPHRVRKLAIDKMGVALRDAGKDTYVHNTLAMLEGAFDDEL